MTPAEPKFRASWRISGKFSEKSGNFRQNSRKNAKSPNIRPKWPIFGRYCRKMPKKRHFLSIMREILAFLPNFAFFRKNTRFFAKFAGFLRNSPIFRLFAGFFNFCPTQSLSCAKISHFGNLTKMSHGTRKSIAELILFCRSQKEKMSQKKIQLTKEKKGRWINTPNKKNGPNQKKLSRKKPQNEKAPARPKPQNTPVINRQKFTH